MAIELTDQVKADLRGVVGLMELNLDKIDMAHWLYNRTPKDAPEGTSCGTVGCIAGYIDLYHGYTDKLINRLHMGLSEGDIPVGATKVDFTGVEDIGPGQLAALLMGQPLPKDAEMDFLFMAGDWPEPFCRQYADLCEDEDPDAYIADGNHKSAGRVVINRLKHFIETGE